MNRKQAIEAGLKFYRAECSGAYRKKPQQEIDGSLITMCKCGCDLILTLDGDFLVK